MNGFVAMNVAVFIWGFTGVLGRAIVLDEINLVFWRLVITVATLAAIFVPGRARLARAWPRLFRVPSGGPAAVAPFSREGLRLAAPGVVLGIHWICFYGAIKYANVSVALTCLGMAPLMAAVLEPLFFRRRVKGSEIFLGAWVFAGILVIYCTHLRFSTGVVYGVLAALFTVVVSVLNKSLVSRHPPARMILFQMTGALALIAAAFAPYAAATGKAFAFPSAADLGYLTILSWGCTIFTFFLWVSALAEVSAFTSNVILTLEPIYGIVLAFAFYREYLDMGRFFYVGFLMIALAVAANVHGTRRRAPLLEP